MKRLFIIWVAMTIAISSHADDHTPSMPTMGAIETFSCNFADDKDMDDFMQVAKKWDEFADEGFSAPYAAYVLNSYYASEMEHDLYWVGFSPNFTAQGITAQEWLEKGTSLNAEFDAVAPCDSHSQFGYMPVRATDAPVSVTGVVDFSGCAMKEGASPVALAVADAKMNAFLDKVGVKVDIARWYPMHGVDLPADFIQVSRFDSLAEKGVAYDGFINAGGPQTQAAIYDSLVQCADGPTSLYNSAGSSSGE